MSATRGEEHTHTHTHVFDVCRSYKKINHNRFERNIELNFMTEHIDKRKLELDIRYRFEYLSKFLNFTSHDIDALNRLAKESHDFIRSVADTIYQKLLEYDITKNYFLKANHGYAGVLITDPNQVTLESEQMHFRIHSIRKYFDRVLRQHVWNDAFLEYISHVGQIHTDMAGTHSINIDYIHVNALLGYIEHAFIEYVLAHEEFNETTKKEMILALSKLFWIQNDFFTMHYIIASKNEH